jgi:hypothetical protein
LDKIGGVVYFTKFDLYLGYHHIKIKKKDIPKTIFITHEGHYEFLVMPLDFIAQLIFLTLMIVSDPLVIVLSQV